MSGGRGTSPTPPKRDGTSNLKDPSGQTYPQKPNFHQEIKSANTDIQKSPKHGSPGKPYLTGKVKMDLDKLPSKLRNLGRSPSHQANMAMQVWTTGLSPTHSGNKGGPGPPGGIIITDVALNQIPNIVIHEAQNSSIDIDSPVSQPLSPAILQRKISDVPYHDRHLLKSASTNSQLYPEEDEEPNFQNIFSRFFGVLKIPPICGLDTVAPSPPLEYNKSQTPYDKKTKKKQMPPGSWLIPKRVRGIVTSENQLQIKREISFGSSDHIHRRLSNVGKIDPNQESGENGKLRAAKSLLDLQREKERSLMHPQRYLDDLKVLHNINRREMVSKLLYRDSGILFSRVGKPGEPIIPKSAHLLSNEGAGPLPIKPKNVHFDKPMPNKDRLKILNKVLRSQPRVLPPGEDLASTSYKESEFIQSCLYAHNLYRARHSAPPLQLSPKLCEMAQEKVNELAHKGKIEYKSTPNFGENFYCKNQSIFSKTKKPMDVLGEEVAAYWYSNIKSYKFNKGDKILQAHAGPFSQMVWVESKMFGIGKARSRSGKVFVVAHYTPSGNIPDFYEENVRPLSPHALAAEIIGKVEREQRGSFMLPFASLSSASLSRKMDFLDTNLLSIDRTPGTIKGFLERKPPTRVMGKNATKILAAHMLGHAASVVQPSEDELQVVIHFSKDGKPKKDVFLTTGPFGHYVKEERVKVKSSKKVQSTTENSPKVDETKKDLVSEKTKVPMKYKLSPKSNERTIEKRDSVMKEESIHSESIPLAAQKYVINNSNQDEHNQSTNSLSFTNNYFKGLENNHDQKSPIRLKSDNNKSNDISSHRKNKIETKFKNTRTKSEEVLVFNPLNHKKLSLRTISLERVFRRVNYGNQIYPAKSKDVDQASISSNSTTNVCDNTIYSETIASDLTSEKSTTSDSSETPGTMGDSADEEEYLRIQSDSGACKFKVEIKTSKEILDENIYSSDYLASNVNSMTEFSESSTIRSIMKDSDQQIGSSQLGFDSYTSEISNTKSVTDDIQRDIESTSIEYSSNKDQSRSSVNSLDSKYFDIDPHLPSKSISCSSSVYPKNKKPSRLLRSFSDSITFKKMSKNRKILNLLKHNRSHSLTSIRPHHNERKDTSKIEIPNYHLGFQRTKEESRMIKCDLLSPINY